MEDLISGERAIKNSARLKFYHDKLLNVTEDFIEHVAHNQSGFEIDTMNELRKCPVPLLYEVNVSWRDFSTAEATWKSLTALHEDCLVLLAQLLSKLADQDLATAARHTLSEVPILASGIFLLRHFSLSLHLQPGFTSVASGTCSMFPCFLFLFIRRIVSHTFRLACCISFP
jgi:hypothetical protein